MVKKDPDRNLSRIEIKSARGGVFAGWEVRVQRRGEKIHKFFNDKKFGGPAGAKKAAREFRNGIEKKMKPFSVAERSKNPSKRNRSGIVGVRRHHQVDNRGDYEYHYHYWIAQWTDSKGRRKTQSFSVEQHGDDKAFKMAMEARRKGVKDADR